MKQTKFLKFLLLYCISLLSLFGFDSVEVLNQNITLHKSGYFKTNKNLTPLEAYNIAISHKLMPHKKDASSFGFDDATYWFVFEISIKESGEYYLDSRNFIAGYQNIYIFEDNKLIQKSKNGYFIDMKDRDVKIFPIRFLLQNNPKKLTYLLEIKNTSPHYTAFALGNANEINQDWKMIYFLMAGAVAIAISFIIYNIFIFIFTKDKLYLFYCLYIFGFLGLNFIGLGYVPMVSFLDVGQADVYFALSVTLKIIGLTFFAILYLQLKEKHQKVAYFMIILMSINALLSILYIYDIGKNFYALSVQLMIITSIFAGITSYIHGYKPAVFYLTATGVGNALFIGFMFMNQGNGLKYTILTLNLSNFAMIWDVVMFSLAMAYRIKLMQEEKIKNEQMLLLQSRQVAIGEFASNVAHQWRQPLTHLSALVAQLKVKLMFDRKVEIDELESFIASSSKTIDHLSSTIDVFQSFYQEDETKQTFSIATQLKRCIEFTKESFEHNAIKVDLTIIQDCYIKGDPNLFSQVILNLLSNAKDALIQSNQEKKIVILSLDTKKDCIFITIEDNGGGIQLKPIEKIFEPYATTKGLNGMGIGLFIVKNIIEQKFGGKINANNTKNGASFVIKL
jgi:signal transduction histidine kinase